MVVEYTPLKPELRGYLGRAAPLISETGSGPSRILLIEIGNMLFIKFGKGSYGWFTLFRFLFGLYCAMMGAGLLLSGETMKQQLSLFAWAAFYIMMSNVWYDVTDFYISGARGAPDIEGGERAAFNKDETASNKEG